MSDEAYPIGSGKRSDYREPQTCVLCGGTAGHYTDCVEVAA